MIARTRLADEVYRHLRAAIANGDLPDGARLLEEELAAEFGISRTPVRQALYRLASDQLVETAPGRSAVVKTMTRQDALDVVETYHTLAHRAYEVGAARLTVADLDAIQAAIDEARSLTGRDPVQAYEVSVRVNERVYAAAGNAVMLRMIALLRPRLDRLLRVRHPDGVAPTTLARMEVQLRALRAGDPETALARVDLGMSQLRAAVERAWPEGGASA